MERFGFDNKKDELTEKVQRISEKFDNKKDELTEKVQRISEKFDNNKKEKLFAQKENSLVLYDGSAIDFESTIGNGLDYNNADIKLGELDKDGFSISLVNDKSGQDAFAVSKDRRTFVVCDGMGGEGGQSNVVAQTLARDLVKEKYFDPKTWTEQNVYNSLEESSKEFPDSASFEGGSTLAIVRIDEDGNELIAFVPSDTAVYIEKIDGSLVSLGNDSIGDLNTGMRSQYKKGEITVVLNESRKITIPLDQVSRFVVASDWLTDSYEAVCKEYLQKAIHIFEEKGDDLSLMGNVLLGRMKACLPNAKSFDPFQFGDMDVETFNEFKKRYNTKPDDSTIITVDLAILLNR